MMARRSARTNAATRTSAAARTSAALGVALRVALCVVCAGLLAIPGQVRAQDAQEVAVATDLSGNWIVTIETPQGEMETTWEIEQAEDGTLTGLTFSDMMGEVPIDGGWVEDGKFGFSILVEGQGQTMDVVYEGSVIEDEVVGFLDAGGGMFQADFIGVRVEGVRLVAVRVEGDPR